MFGNVQRRGRFQCVSSLLKLKDVSVSTLFTFLDTIVETGADNRKYIGLRALIAGMIKEAYSQSYTLSNVVIQSEDFRFKENGNTRTFADLKIVVKNSSGANIGYRTTWPTGYDNCFDLLVDVLSNFGLVAEYFYDGTHKIRLLTRGRSYIASPITLPIPIASTRQPLSDIFVSLVRGTSRAFGLNQAFWKTANFDGTGELPPLMNADMDINVLFHQRSTQGPDTESLYVFPGGFNTQQKITSMQYYDYVADAFSADITPELGTPYYRPIVEYLWYRFGAGNIGYEREYATLQANDGTTTTHLNLRPLVQTVIEGKRFYATEVRKNVMTNRSFVKWIEV